MATLGSVIVKLEAQSSAFTKGMKEVQHAVEGVGHTLNEFKSLAMEALAFVGVGIGVEALKGMVEQTMTTAKAAWELSASLGMSTQSLMGLQVAAKRAGVDTESFNTTLDKMTKNIGEAATGGGAAADTLAKLGLNAKTLAASGVEASFKAIADKVKDIENPMERAVVVTDLFGKSGQKLLPMFMEGAEGIEKAVQQARDFGLALDDIEAAKIVAAHEAFEQMGEKIEGIKNQLTVALAPALTAIVDKIIEIMPSAETMREVFVSVIHSIAYGVAYLMDIWEGLKIAIDGIKWIAQKMAEGVLWAIKKLIDGLIWLEDALGMNTETEKGWANSIQQSMNGVAADADKTAKDINATLLKKFPTEKVDEFFNEINKKAAATAAELYSKRKDFASPLTDAFLESHKKITGILDELKKEIDTFGMSSDQKKIFDLTKLGASPAEIANAQKMINQLDALKQHQEAIKEASKLTENMKSPIEKYEEEIDKLDSLLMQSLITNETYDRAVAKAQKQMAKDMGLGEEKKIGAQVRRFEFALPQKAKMADPVDTLVGVQRQAAQEQKKQTGILSKIAGKGDYEVVNF